MLSMLLGSERGEKEGASAPDLQPANAREKTGGRGLTGGNQRIVDGESEVGLVGDLRPGGRDEQRERERERERARERE
eukprot:106818-Rhodomonas_salina.1